MKKIIKTIEVLSKYHKEKSVVDLGDPFYVLIATVISQRVRDEVTKKISKQLFKKYSNPKQLAGTNLADLEKILKPAGLSKTKAINIKEISKILIENYHGKPPRDIEKLIRLPGVGRKTANCVLNYGYKLPAIAVDIHVHRIANRLGWIRTKTPDQTEMELEKIIPKEYWVNINIVFVNHGRLFCRSNSPKCDTCPVKKYCNYADKFMDKGRNAK